MPFTDQIIDGSEIRKLKKSEIHFLSRVTTQRSAEGKGMSFMKY